MTGTPPGACGRGCAPVPSIPYGGEDCLSAAPVLSVAKELSISDRLPTKNRFFTAFRMTTFGFSWGPRPGANGFGSFCRNKRTSSCGGETPQSSPSSCGAETPQSSSLRRAGAKPRIWFCESRNPASLFLLGLFEPKPVFPAGQGDDGAGCVIIVGGLPRGPSLGIKRGCGTTHNAVQRVFLGKRKRVPSGSDVDPQQGGQAGRVAGALDALIGIRGQRGFCRLRVTLRRSRLVDHNSRQHKTCGHKNERQNAARCAGR